VFNSVIGALTIFVLTVYLLVEGPRAATSVLALLPRKERLPVRRMVGEIGVQVGAYMRGQLITSLLAGAFAFILLTALNVPEPLALAFLMMVADVVPLVGPLIGTVPAVLMALGGGLPAAAIVLSAYLAYQQVEGNVIVPRVYGNALKLSPLVVLVAFLVGGKLLGMLGVLLALPTAAAIPIIARYVGEWRERVDADSLPALAERLP
jgi:predicted PurR-regulated permease PerM